MKKEKYIAIFCSAQDLAEKYTKPARELAKKIAEHGYHLVWGGSDTGLMKIIADEVQKSGGKLVGISVKFLHHFARKNADEMIIAADLGERKAKMLFRCDALVVLVGGTGTLDEATDVLELRKQDHHKKPIIFLNTENFYEGLKVQLQKMRDDGFIKRPLEGLVFFADTPQEAIDYIDKNLRRKNIKII